MELLNNSKAYKTHVRRRLAALNAVLENAAEGKFSILRGTPPAEFTKLYSAINQLLKAVQVKMEELGAIRAMEEAIIESVGEGLVAVDGRMQVTLINGRALKLLGMRSDRSVMGKHIEEVMLLEDEEGNSIVGSDRPTSSAVGKRRRIALQRPYYYIRRKDGTRFPVALTAAPIILDRKSVGGVSVFRDITEQRRIDEAKTEFISLASHQLRTPLSIISLNLEILFKHYPQLQEETEVREHLETIHNASRRMNELVTELLNVSKIDMGSLDINVEAVDLVALLRECAKSIEELAGRKQLQVVCDFKVSKAPLQSDPRLLRVIFDNLLSNAVKYSGQSKSIGITLTLKSGGVSVSIRDQGCGIPVIEQDQIFSKFFRAQNVQRREEGGTGLGLFIVHSLVAALGGSISFISKEGKGTTFTVALPRKGAAGQYKAGVHA